jgi:hypothetical protein
VTKGEYERVVCATVSMQREREAHARYINPTFLYTTNKIPIKPTNYILKYLLNPLIIY